MIRNPESKERKPQLIGRIEYSRADFNDAIILTDEDGLITVSTDRAIKIWIKRETGKYWPTVDITTDSCGTCLNYHSESRRLFIGLENGTILEYAVSEDYNKMTLIKQYQAHQSKVTNVYYTLESDWILSTSQDKFFTWHSTDNSQRIGSYLANASCFCLAYDTPSKHCFIGDSSGNISFIKLSNTGCEFIANLSGHEAAISSLFWDVDKKYLFSASFDKKVIAWDIGGQKGQAYDLEGHSSRVYSVIYSSLTCQLITGSEDCRIGCWDMMTKRIESPLWKTSDICELCSRPFFWNVKEMWTKKQVGLRQHHCRLCGSAVCDTCSPHKSTLPKLGQEVEVRICIKCYPTIVAEE